ncbi:hypothetical protein [Flavobacterium psychrophilum]|uniref:hypothetical protein n=1 Tax=Flavobacterium psychrophilum TaxID=96345 RepID=UPI001D0723D3|nr:hypothetical protein [Flavobacterium psychrophilum]MCB6088849.1 hypothetical protein [Flavobacterium psychrophilum]
MSKINIFETDFSQKYLITTSNNTTFYCGVIMKDILNHFNEKMLIQDIVNAVNIKYKTSYSEFEINQSIRNMQNNENITKLSFRPLLSLINSEKIPSLKLRALKKSFSRIIVN